MDSRRQPPSASSSTSRSRENSFRSGLRGKGASVRSVSSGSVTPLQDEEEKEAPRRTTRAKNPLPPTTGPLFPPLPPKPPKASPKASPRAKTSARSTPVLPPNSSLSVLANDEPPEPTNIPTSPTSPTRQVERDIPSISNASLTPPPPSEGKDVLEPEIEEEESEAAEEDWDSYRRHRHVRGFTAAKNGVKVESEARETTPLAINEVAEEGPAEEPDPPEDEEQLQPFEEETEQAEINDRQTRKRRGEGQLLMDDHLLPKEIKEKGQVSGKRGRDGLPKPVEDAEPAEEEEDEAKVDVEENAIEGDEEFDDEAPEITRCVCKQDGDEIDSMFIQCDTCNVWQHGGCVGIWADEEAPDNYYCEKCRPELHVALRKWLRRRHFGTYIPPTPADLESCHPGNDNHPPSQSKRWKSFHTKPPSRSHHRKPSPEAVSDNKRARRVPARTEKSTSVVEPPKESKKPISHNRKVSMSALKSPSPGTSTSPQPHVPTKRRSTMNSRDAAYEEQVKAALEASKREMEGTDMDGHDAENEQEQKDDEEVVEIEKKRRRKKEDAHREIVMEEDDDGHLKPKHPNQYTYRPKLPIPQPAPSPIRRVAAASTPIPSLPPATHEHGTRRAGAIATAPQVFSNSVDNLSWHLPEHLSSFNDLLPTETPIPIEVRSARTMTSISRNHYLNHKYGPFAEERDGNNKLLLPDDLPPREPIGEPSTHMEPPTRVKYPIKRITTAEVRKRVRNILDYVGRVRLEEEKRRKRAGMLGIDPDPLPRVKRVSAEDDGSPEVERMEVDNEIPEHDVQDTPSSTQILDEIERDIIAFQETVQTGLNGYSSPMPSSLPNFTHRTWLPSTPSLLGMHQNGSPTPVTETSKPNGFDDPAVNGKLEIETEMVMPAEGGEMVPVQAGPEIDVYREGVVDKIGLGDEPNRMDEAKVGLGIQVGAPIGAA